MENIKKYDEFVLESLELYRENLESFLDNLKNNYSVLFQKIVKSVRDKNIKLSFEDFDDSVSSHLFTSEDDYIVLTNIYFNKSPNAWVFDFKASWTSDPYEISISIPNQKGLSKIYNGILAVGNIQNAFQRINQT